MRLAYCVDRYQLMDVSSESVGHPGAAGLSGRSCLPQIALPSARSWPSSCSARLDIDTSRRLNTPQLRRGWPDGRIASSQTSPVGDRK
jgi:hypothetical protein